MNFRIEKYSKLHFTQWNDLIGRSKNGTFLFHRDFMEYHSDRFNDYSLLVFDGDRLRAAFPANIVSGELISHQGLTYGGLIYEDRLPLVTISEMFKAIVDFVRSDGVLKILVKQIPYIYYKCAANEMDYILHKEGASQYRKDLNLAIDFSKKVNISKSKLKHFRRISNLGLEVKLDQDFELFWDKVLVPRLGERHNVKPVHTKEEIRLLHNRFPSNILQYNVYKDGEILAGITIFHCGNVIKSQYGATTKEGEKVRALDFVFITLINEYRDKVSFFDMGTVTDNSPDGYNNGLLTQKQELGCSIYLQDFYALQTNKVSFGKA